MIKINKFHYKGLLKIKIGLPHGLVRIKKKMKVRIIKKMIFLKQTILFFHYRQMLRTIQEIIKINK